MWRSTLLLALAAVPSAQGEIKAFPVVDPYTKSAPEAIEKAGYVSLGPFRFGNDHTTDQVVSTLGGIPMLWVESAHFKLGSTLPEYTPTDKKEKDRLRDELERLSQRLPDVKVRVRKLDPWLRLHLFAQRLEELYTEFQRVFGLTETVFPTGPVAEGTEPYLGQPGKFTVLVFDKKSSVGRYSRVYLGRPIETPFRWNFADVGSLFFCTAFEFLEGDYANDSALTCDVLTGVSQNLAQAYRGYTVDLPLGVSEGLAHWFSRRFDPRYHLFSGTDLTKIRVKDEWNWAPSVRARVEHKVFPTLEELLGWNDPDALEWADHLMLWSRMDYLLARDDGAAGRVLFALKEPPAGPLTPEQLADRARQAFHDGSGQDLAAQDRAWAEWVLANYPTK